MAKIPAREASVRVAFADRGAAAAFAPPISSPAAVSRKRPTFSMRPTAAATAASTPGDAWRSASECAALVSGAALASPARARERPAPC